MDDVEEEDEPDKPDVVMEDKEKDVLPATVAMDDDLTEDESLSQVTQMSSPSQKARSSSSSRMEVDVKEKEEVEEEEDSMLLQSEKTQLDPTMAMSEEEQPQEATLPLS